MRLECERKGDKYRLHAVEGGRRWALVPPGTAADAQERWLSHEDVVSAALLAGFSTRAVERALLKAELHPDPG
jgi:hypothetical protein